MLERGHTGAAPWGGVVDVCDGVHGLKGAGKFFGDDGHDVACFLEEDGGTEADDASAGECQCFCL